MSDFKKFWNFPERGEKCLQRGKRIKPTSNFIHQQCWWLATTEPYLQPPEGKSIWGSEFCKGSFTTQHSHLDRLKQFTTLRLPKKVTWGVCSHKMKQIPKRESPGWHKTMAGDFYEWGSVSGGRSPLSFQPGAGWDVGHPAPTHIALVPSFDHCNPARVFFHCCHTWVLVFCKTLALQGGSLESSASLANVLRSQILFQDFKITYDFKNGSECTSPLLPQ